MQLRPYQEDCLNAIVQSYQEGVHQQLAVLATGLGKTVIFSHLPGKFKGVISGKMLVFAHRTVLIDQALSSLRCCNPNLKCGKEMAEHYADADCDIIVSCVASIGRNGATRLQRFGEFGIVVCDETHRILAATYLNVLEQTGVLQPDTKKLLVGFTATPRRKNLTRKEKQQKLVTLDDENLISLKSVFKKIVYSYPLRKGIKDGFLCSLRGFRLKTDVCLDDVKVVGGEFQADQLSIAVNTSERNLQIVKSWIENAQGRQTVGFTAGIQHAKDLATAFVENGIKAEALWGEDVDRTAKMLRLRSKEMTVALNAQLLTEGFDLPSISCILLAAPTRNSSVYIQEVGRGTRLCEGKEDCLVLDCVDVSKKCSLVTFPSLLGLNPEMDLQGESITKAVETLEALQEKYPGISFEHLTDLSKVQAYVESIDILADPFTTDVKEFSKLTWMQGQDGSYILAIPEKKEIADAREFYRYLHEKLHISQNELEEIELSITTVNDERKLGTFNSLQEAFSAAEDVIHRCRPDRVKLLLRESPWHSNLASEPVKRYLRKLTKKKPFLLCLCENISGTSGNCLKCKKPLGLTAGKASLAVNRLQHMGK